mmetsp:Transcript_29215/g.58694  ORF Transcript_29215/g.58694 Transcript_29215/m.58694 type:complete len:412 (-) Transcript_29215:169-1404(-)
MVLFHENDFDYDEFAKAAVGKANLPIVNGEEAEEILEEASGSAGWEAFYQRETDPYKPRRYLSAEFPELLQGSTKALLKLPRWFHKFPAVRAVTGCTSPLLFDVGCGYGSALVPLLLENPCLRAVACDLSSTAIDALQEQNPECQPPRVRSRPWDITHGLPPELAASDDDGRTGSLRPSNSSMVAERADLALLVFTLSAVDPKLHVQVLRDVKRSLKPGSGIICFRDRARFDLTELRSKKRLAEGTYARDDGTLAHYFTVEEIEGLAKRAGLDVVGGGARYCTVRMANRRKGTAMSRCYVHAKFCRPAEEKLPNQFEFENENDGFAPSLPPQDCAELPAAPSGAAITTVNSHNFLWLWRLSSLVTLAAAVHALVRPSQNSHLGQKVPKAETASAVVAACAVSLHRWGNRYP